jgi:prophage DNA circulation protein
MPSTTADARDAVTPVAEATRFVAETSRRSAEGARAAVEATRAFFDDTVEVRRKLFDTWANNAEATLQATFELQNASLATGLALLDTAASAQRTVAKQWETAAHQAQQAGLDAFRDQVRAAARLVPGAA